MLEVLDVCVWAEDGFTGCLCISYVRRINTCALRHLSMQNLHSSALKQYRTQTHITNFGTVLQLTFVAA